MTVAQTILNQLGGSKFVAMTGSKTACSLDNMVLYVKLKRNKSKANYLKIEYKGYTDLYDMTFSHITGHKYNAKTGIFRNGKKTIIAEYKDVMCDRLQELFTGVTGMYTGL